MLRASGGRNRRARNGERQSLNPSDVRVADTVGLVEVRVLRPDEAPAGRMQTLMESTFMSSRRPGSRDVLLRACSLRVRFGGAKTPVFDGLDASVSAGESVALAGPNGCGKSTLLAALVGLVPFEAGEVWLGGERLDPRSGRARRHVGWVSDEYPILLKLTVQEYLALVATLHGVPRELAAQRLERLRSDLRLAELEPVCLDVCSHGMAKRAMLAAALLPDPPLLLLDEPETGLDRSALAFLTRVLHERRARGCGALVATHDSRWAAETCDRVLVFEGRRLEELRSPEARVRYETNDTSSAGGLANGASIERGG